MVLLPHATCIAKSYFCRQFLTSYAAELRSAAGQHVRLTVLAVVIALLASVPLVLTTRRSPTARTLVLAAAGGVYALPSLSLFILLQPAFGVLTDTPVLIALTLYNLLVLLRNLFTGLDGVDPDVVEAARGMGYGPGRLFLRVELPLALPAVLAGVRVATVSTIALVSVGGLIGQGGLGDLLYQGFQFDRRSELMTSLLLIVALAVIADLLLLALQRSTTRWSRARVARA